MQGDITTVRAGWLIDGTGDPVQLDRMVTIRSGCIASIDPFVRRNIPEKGYIDFSHATLLPALMDAHVHLTLSGTLDPAARQTQLQQTAQTARDAIGDHIEAHRRHGVAAVRHAGDPRGDLADYRPAMASTLTVKVAGWAWHAQGRYGGMIGKGWPQEQGLDHAIRQGPKNQQHIKIINSGINSLDCFGRETRPQFSLADLRRACRYGHRQNLPVMVHANGKTAVRESIEAGCHSIEHGYFMGADNLPRMADHGTFWVPTAVPMAALTRKDVVAPRQAAIAQRTLDHQLEQIARGHQMGVAMALGTDAGSMGAAHGAGVRHELALFMAAGLPLSQAVRCATLNAATLMGLAQRGALLPGWRADFIAVDGPASRLPESLVKIAALFIRGQREDLSKPD